tara:strand:+ start:3457 stop:4356 length:900 start_codon:yes stop_codon:yes gene_type:complete
MNDNEIDIYEIISVLYRKKISILAISLLFIIISLVIAFSVPNKYSSVALLAPSGDQNTNKMLGQMGGLASLASFTLDENSSKTEEAIERIQSFEFFEQFIFSEGMLLNLMASKGWDSNSKQVVYDSKKYDFSNRQWVRKSPIPFTAISKKPSLQEAYNSYLKMLYIAKDSRTGFTEISATHYSPYVAQRWCSKIISEINRSMREDERLRVQRSIDFLNDQYLDANYKEIKIAASSLIEEQMKSLMYVEASESFVFKVIDSPIVSEFKSSPKRSLILIAGFIMGLITSFIIILYSHYRNK